MVSGRDRGEQRESGSDGDGRNPYPIEIGMEWDPRTGQLNLEYPQDVDPAVVLGVLGLADFYIKSQLAQGSKSRRSPIAKPKGPLPGL